MKNSYSPGRILIGAGALILAASFFLPMVDVFGPYSPLEGVVETFEDSLSGWRRADLAELLSWGAYSFVIALPHAFALLALVLTLSGSLRMGAMLLPLLFVVWFFAFAVLLGALVWEKGFDSVGGHGWIHLGLAMVVIAFGVPWIRRPLPRWSADRLVCRCLLVGAVAAIAWFTMWAWELDLIHYGLVVAIVASVVILVGALRLSVGSADPQR